MLGEADVLGEVEGLGEVDMLGEVEGLGEVDMLGEVEAAPPRMSRFSYLWTHACAGSVGRHDPVVHGARLPCSMYCAAGRAACSCGSVHVLDGGLQCD